MSDALHLPKNWVQVTVADLGKVVSGGTPSTKENSYWGGNISWISPSDLTGYSDKYISKGAKSITQEGLKNSSATIMPAGSIHFSSRAPIGYTVISSREMTTNQGFKSLVPAQGVFNEYIYYYFKSAKQLAESRATGTTFKEISGAAFSKLPVPLPPTNEQHRIVAKIEELFSELDSGLENLKTARAQLKVYRQALLKHAFEGKLTAQWRAENQDKLETAEALLKRIQQERAERYQQQLADWEASGKQCSKPKAPKPLSPLTAEERAELPELPERGGWCKLGDFIDSIDAGKSFKCDEREPRADEIGVAKVSAVTWGEYDETESKTCTDTSKENEAYLIRSGDFILSRANTIDLVGACVIARKVTKKIMLSDKTLRIKFDGFSQEYFLQYLGSRIGRKQIMRLSTGNQESMRNIGQDRIRSITVPICSGIEAEVVMDALASKLSEVGQLELTISTSLQQAEALRQSILKKAFSGQLVEQDANDEPASLLLARIKAEKAEQAVTAKLRKPQKEQTQSVSIQTNVVPFPAKIANISATDLHAGIIALAYQRHEQSPEFLKYFHHVKVEKIIHLVEAHLGIDLERMPIKDAAGPNDFSRLKRKVEPRAKIVNWFDVRQEKPGGMYIYHKMPKFDDLISKTRIALGERLTEVDALIGMFLKWRTEHSEVIATLYAAWNNLLLLGLSPSDEEIVYEARENWHEAKLKIEREKFFMALKWMHKHGLVPVGRGRFVAKKGEQSKSGEVKHD